MHPLEKHWQRFTWVSLLLIPLSALFACVSGLRRFAYRCGLLQRHRLPVPVIIVGNISVGGTGKTPAVLWLAQALRERGRNPGIVSRGYGGSGQLMAVGNDSDPAEVGDEPALLASRTDCPVVIGRDRVAAARLLLSGNAGIDVILSDDGLQHYRLGRDVEIALIDGRRGTGNGWLLPAGPLRERTWRLQSVDAIVTNGSMSLKSSVPTFNMDLKGALLHKLRDTASTRAIESFAGKPLHALAGIGDPQRFFDQLRQAGLSIHAHPFADHHRFTAADLEFGDDLPVIMTEKDAIKCRSFARDHWWMLPVDAQIDPGLADLVNQKITQSRGR